MLAGGGLGGVVVGGEGKIGPVSKPQPYHYLYYKEAKSVFRIEDFVLVGVLERCS